MTLRLPKAMVLEMVAHAIEDLPNECCGYIAGENGAAQKVYRARNGEPLQLADGTVEYKASPFRYYVHPLDQLRIEKDIDDHDWQVLVIYHSHVGSDAYPSPTDVRMSHFPNNPAIELYPGAYYALVSLKDPTNVTVRAYKISNGEVSEEPIEAS
jgi:proteasome lid subunit RPN8/RPN11